MQEMFERVGLGLEDLKTDLPKFCLEMRDSSNAEDWLG